MTDKTSTSEKLELTPVQHALMQIAIGPWPFEEAMQQLRESAESFGFDEHAFDDGYENKGLGVYMLAHGERMEQLDKEAQDLYAKLLNGREIVTLGK